MEIEKLKIIPFSIEIASVMMTLNFEWLEKYFEIEPADIKTLSNPKEEIIDKGGYIFFIELQGTIVGTASLIKVDQSSFELSKMAITETVQGKGIGAFLLDYCIDFARSKSTKKIILFSNTKLVPAIKLYEKFGFKEISLGNVIYKRSNIKMEKNLDPVDETS